MSLLLNIDTATDIASVCISEDGAAISYRENNQQKEHASFVHTAIESMLMETGKDVRQIDAFAVTSGPGSYTGLRVGMATAKGFCYALQKPLIAINTLQVMAQAAITEHSLSVSEKALLYCPMIDARRLEVFTALYNSQVETVLSPAAIVLEENFFGSQLKDYPILFFGSGSEKLKAIVSHKNASFVNINHTSIHLAKLACKAFKNNQFADVAYSEPDYGKAFYSTLKP